MTIQNLESFYNYRTVGVDFSLSSSILSNLNTTIKLTVLTYDENIEFRVINEAVDPVIETTNLLNLHLKKHRITSGFRQIKNNYASNTEWPSENFMNYFVPVQKQLPVQTVVPYPNYCRPLPGTEKRPACSNCSQLCAFSMEAILHPIRSIGQVDLNMELQAHGHPTSRHIKTTDGRKRARLTHEAARELADHYKYFHRMEEPSFLW